MIISDLLHGHKAYNRSTSTWMQWQADGEDRAVALSAFDLDGATVLLNNLAAAGKAEARPLKLAAHVVGAVERIENVWEISRRDANALVADRDNTKGCLGVNLFTDGNEDRAVAWTELERIRNQINQDTFKAHIVPFTDNARHRGLESDARSRRLKLLDDLLREDHQVGGPAVKIKGASHPQASNVEQLVDHPHRAARVPFDTSGQFGQLFRIEERSAREPSTKKLGVTLGVAEGPFQIVGDTRDEHV